MSKRSVNHPAVPFDTQSTTARPSSKKVRLSHDDRFRLKSGRLSEFIAMRKRLPRKEMIHTKITKLMKDEEYEKLSNESKAKYKLDMENNELRVKNNPRDPYERENAIFVDNCRQNLPTMKPERIRLLDSIHTGILAPIKTSHQRSIPLQGWTEKFKAWASTATKTAVRSPRFPSTQESYVSSAQSFKEHMVKKSGCHLRFKPSNCCPTKTKPGTMADIFSYALFPRIESLAKPQIIVHETIKFDDVPARDYIHHSGTMIQPESTSSKLKELIANAEKILLPNNLIDRIRE